MMYLHTLLKRAQAVSFCTKDIPIAGVTASSKKCAEGFLFVACKGATPHSRDGHDFIDNAIQHGAVAAVVDQSFLPKKDYQIPLIPVANSKRALCYLVEAFYDFPSHKLAVIGITGTNGKTSTTFMLHSILVQGNFRPKIMGTLGVGDPNALTPVSHTTMEPEFISAYLARSVKEGVTHVIMEVSSHALCLDRVLAIKFAAVGLTNITQDHLDFHGTLENYRAAKARLFFELADHDTKIILPDDHPFKEIISTVVKTTKKQNFQQKNANLAHAIASALGVNEQVIKGGLRECLNIPGRLELISHDHDFLVYVDFAHTPHALTELCATLRPLTPKRLILVFGCGGDREREKRALMGEIASRLADVVIITDDNPRGENPTSIRAQILSGTKTLKKATVHEIADRRSAIAFAINSAQKNDVVVIAGKGHENYQIYDGMTIHFSDQEEAKKVLERL